MDNFRDSYFKIDWDLSQKRLKGTFWGKQYDTGRGFEVTVINGGQVLTATTEVLRLKWEKPDNTAGYVNATVVNGKFIIENIDQMFTVQGSVRADFELSVAGETLASITFYVSVEKAVAVDAIESSSEFTALQSAIAAADDVQAQVDAVIANATVDSEVILARGTEATLGARLDSTDAQLAEKAKQVDLDYLYYGEKQIEFDSVGTYNSSGVEVYSTTRIRTKIIPVKSNATIVINCGSLQCGIFLWSGSIATENLFDSGWKTGIYSVTVDTDGYLAIMAKKINSSLVIIENFDGNITITQTSILGLEEKSEEFGTSIQLLNNQVLTTNTNTELVNGTVNTLGEFVINSKRVRTKNLINLEYGGLVSIKNGGYRHVCVIWSGEVLSEENLIRNDTTYILTDEDVMVTPEMTLCVAFKNADGSTINVSVFDGSVIVTAKTRIDSISDKVEELETTILNGELKVLALGDSRTDASAYLGQKNAMSLLATKYGWVLTNEAKSGTGFLRRYGSAENSLVDKIVSYTDTYDLIYLNLGVNDFINPESPLGTTNDTIPDTIYGAIDYCFSKIVEMNPLAKVFIQTPLPKVNGRINNSQGWNMDDLVEAIITKAKKFFFFVDDLYHNGCFFADNATFNATYTYNSDGLHPSEEWVRKYLYPHTDKMMQLL